MTDDLLPEPPPFDVRKIFGEPWEDDLDAVRKEWAPPGLARLLEAIDVLAWRTSDLPEPDTATAEWTRLAVLLEALGLVHTMPDDLPGLTNEEMSAQETVIDARQGVAYVRRLLAGLERRREAETSMGLPRYVLATADAQDLTWSGGERDMLGRTRRMHLAWEYAHGKAPNGKPWSIDKLATHVGLTKGRAQALIEDGRQLWAKGGAALPR